MTSRRCGGFWPPVSRAAEPGSTLLVVEGVVPTGPEPFLLYMINLFLLVQVGGRERTREQHHALVEAAGYRLERIIPPRPGSSVGLSLLEADRR
jgi:O-methyltransferase domain